MASDMISLRARSIAVIGAGPSGIVAAKYLRAENAFDKIVLFEQRNRAGGIWNYTPDDRDEDLFTIPQTNPRGRNQDPVWRETTRNSNTNHALNGTNGVHTSPTFLSPIYEKLETNIPRGLMGFQDLNWPEDSQLFPKHETVLSYIEEYSEDVQDLIQYETQVVNVEPTPTSQDSKWNVTTRKVRTDTSQTDTFDAVIVANGHFIVPYIPDISGIREWNEKLPGTITHSKYYRRPEEFIDKKVIVVGNSASGVDISTQICAYSQYPLLWSNRPGPNLFRPADSDPRKRELPPIASLDPSTHRVEFEDGSVEIDVDAIVFATGYFYSLPFLENVEPKLITDGSHVRHTYQHLFYAPQPTLSFLVLNQRVIPFPVSEAQSAVLARVYSGRLSLPSLTEMKAWEQTVISEMGDGRNFHLLPFPKDANYINGLSKWALTAPPRDGLESGGKGKVPPVWGEWEFWCRENFPAIRQAFGKLGEKRQSVRSLDEVGFSYKEYLRTKAGEEGKLI